MRLPSSVARHGDAGRAGGEADRRISHVRVLAAGSARTIGVYPEVLVFNLDIHVFGKLGPDVQRGEGRVTPRRLVERGNPDEPVHASLGREESVRIVAGDGDGDALETGLVAGLVVDHFTLETSALEPSQVHPQEHLSPIL